MAMPLSAAPLRRARFYFVAVLPATLLLVGLLGHLRLGLWVSSAPCAKARGCFAAYRCAAPGRSPAPCAVFRGCCAASYSAALGAPLPLLPGFVGAPPLFVRLLASAMLRVGLPFLAAPLLPYMVVYPS